MSITFTVEQIRDLARFAGLSLSEDCAPDADELETEITVTDCPASGVAGDDDGRIAHYRYIAYCTDYPEEGGIGLGPEIDPPKGVLA